MLYFIYKSAFLIYFFQFVCLVYSLKYWLFNYSVQSRKWDWFLCDEAPVVSALKLFLYNFKPSPDSSQAFY